MPASDKPNSEIKKKRLFVQRFMQKFFKIVNFVALQKKFAIEKEMAASSHTVVALSFG